jgi:hypothetical protein
MDTDAKSCLSKDPAKVLETHEKEKKRKYLKPCLEQQRRHFTPFVVSTDGLIGKEAKTFTYNLRTVTCGYAGIKDRVVLYCIVCYDMVVWYYYCILDCDQQASGIASTVINEQRQPRMLMQPESKRVQPIAKI